MAGNNRVIVDDGTMRAICAPLIDPAKRAEVASFKLVATLAEIRRKERERMARDGER